MYSKRHSSREKRAVILIAVWGLIDAGKRTSIYAVAKQAGYTPNGSFSASVWECIDAGLLNASPMSTSGGRYAWSLDITQSGRMAVVIYGLEGGRHV